MQQEQKRKNFRTRHACQWRLRAFFVLSLVFAVTRPTQVFAQFNPPAAAPAFRQDRILVKPKPGTDPTPLHRALGLRMLRNFEQIGNLGVLQLPDKAPVAATLARLRQSGLVEYAEPDYIVTALIEPNDFRYWDESLWSLHNTGIYGGLPGADIDAPLGWNVQNTASNVIVAVMDTGVRFTHEDLAANMWVNPGESGRSFGLDLSTNSVDDDCDGFIDDLHGINAILGTGVPLDDYGHGTHVAGIIGAVGNNTVGIVGVCWRVQIMACKFLDSTGHGSISDAITCIDYARRKGAKIINSSWGDYAYNSTALFDAIRSARDAGIIFVAACGNNGNNNDVNPLYPASFRLDNVIAVAATTRTDELAVWSNYGPTNVHIAAPGDPIFSCWNNSDGAYQYYNGTSMAAPHVAGVCALVWAHYPSDNYRQVINRVLAGAEPLPALTNKCVTGGRLNLARALAASPGVVADFVASPGAGSAPLTVTFTDTSTGGPTGRLWDFGDGTSTSTNRNPTHVYLNAGSFTPTLTVTGLNKKSSKSRVVQAFAASGVTVNFTANPASGTAPLAVQFSDASTGNATGWLWDFGDGTAPVTDRNPSHAYVAAGVFTATLTVNGSSGVAGIKSLNVQVACPSGLARYPFRLRGDSNEIYRIEASTNLKDWTVVSTNRASSNGTVIFTDPQAGSFLHRLYRGAR